MLLHTQQLLSCLVLFLVVQHQFMQTQTALLVTLLYHQSNGRTSWATTIQVAQSTMHHNHKTQAVKLDHNHFVEMLQD